MKRAEFLSACLLAPAASLGFAGTARTAVQANGARRLSRDRNFVTWHPGMEPAYRVKTGEVVLVDMTHGLPGLVTREGVF